MQKIPYPQSKGTTLSINMTAKTVRLSILENQNEQLQRELKNTPELIPEDARLLFIAGNTTMTLTGKTRK